MEISIWLAAAGKEFKWISSSSAFMEQESLQSLNTLTVLGGLSSKTKGKCSEKMIWFGDYNKGALRLSLWKIRLELSVVINVKNDPQAENFNWV